MVEDVELNRLYWHSRRGMLELDVLLVPFVKEVYAHLNQVDRDCYVRLLECEDQDMFGWFMERSESEDPELQRMVSNAAGRPHGNCWRPISWPSCSRWARCFYSIFPYGPVWRVSCCAWRTAPGCCRGRFS